MKHMSVSFLVVKLERSWPFMSYFAIKESKKARNYHWSEIKVSNLPFTNTQ